MNTVRDYWQRIRADRRAVRRLYAVSFLCALFLLVMILKSSNMSGRYLVDKEGNLIGIERGYLNRAEEFDIDLKIITEDGESKRELNITKNPVQGKSAEKSKDAAADSRQQREAEITGIITDIELSGEKKIIFPAKLSDGSVLRWSIRDDSGGDIAIIPLLYIILVFAVIKTSLDSGKGVDKSRKESITRALPRFTNQLMLMMNAGMILSDAFERICDSYRLIPEGERSFFEAEMIRIHDENKDHRISTATVISEFASEYNVKEMLRIAAILTENEKRGSDVLENLNRESKYLWDNRKLVAIERGKMIDTRMAYPLGMLLVLLIVITMAPALMSM